MEENKKPGHTFYLKGNRETPIQGLNTESTSMNKIKNPHQYSERLAATTVLFLVFSPRGGKNGREKKKAGKQRERDNGKRDEESGALGDIKARKVPCPIYT